MSERAFEVVVFGATGFTGLLVARYLANTATDLRWALAGRNVARLEAIRAQLPEACADLPLIEADVSKPETLNAMAQQTSTVLTTVGPFAQYGPPLVEACVNNGTHYADITGEPDFVAEMYRRFNGPARDAGVRIVNCCGFDSIPHDLGAWHCVQQLPKEGRIEVRGYVQTRGGISGGTWNTALAAMGQGRPPNTKGWLPSGDDRTARGLKQGVHRAEIGGYAAPMPTIDPLMVLRSAQDLGYGPDFHYGHYARFKTLRWMLGTGIGVGAVATMAQVGPLRRWLGSRRPPGSGPTQEKMDKGWMNVEFIGIEGQHRAHTAVRCDMDPGYAMTSRMVAESALCLARDGDQLDPEQVGVLTPAAAMAAPLVTRLERAGMRFEVL